MKLEKIVEKFLERGVQVNEDMVIYLATQSNTEELVDKILRKIDALSEKPLLVTEEMIPFLLNGEEIEINWNDFVEWKYKAEVGETTETFKRFLERYKKLRRIEVAGKRNTVDFKILKNYDKSKGRGKVEDFLSYFLDRYNKIKNLIGKRLFRVVSINRLNNKFDEEISVIGIVTEKREGNQSYILEVEDPTGLVRVIIPKDNPQLSRFYEEIVHDEIIGITGIAKGKIIYANNIIFPDVSITKEKRKLNVNEDVYAIFTSDIHVGSSKFLKSKFEAFIEWLNSDKEIPSKVEYIFIAGDLVDGIGVYPNQEEELEITDIYEQYTALAEYLRRIPEDIKIFIIPGNHDAVRLAQPQPPVPKDIAGALYDLDNVVMLSNPAYIRLESSNTFINVLMYHGVSFDAMIEKINKLSYENPGEVMVTLLKKRHLSPIHGLDILPQDYDCLVIDEDIDIIHTGHVHINGLLEYKNILLINSGAWQAQTDYQKLIGHVPTPGQVPVVNLRTREAKIVKF